MGLLLAVFTRIAGSVWGSLYDCARAEKIRIRGAITLYSLATVMVGIGLYAQTFPRDSSVVAQVPRSSPDSLWQQQMTELLDFMKKQELLEARRVGDREDVLRRIQALEAIKPDVLVEKIKTIEEKLTGLDAAFARNNQVLTALVLAVLTALFTNWLTSRSKTK